MNKPKKPKPRFNTAVQIKDKINEYLIKAEKISHEADDYDRRRKEANERGDLASAEWCGKRADALRRSVKRIQDDKLKRLKEKLSEWMTDPLPGITEDRSVSR